jgi:hypothetical protein
MRWGSCNLQAGHTYSAYVPVWASIFSLPPWGGVRAYQGWAMMSTPEHYRPLSIHCLGQRQGSDVPAGTNSRFVRQILQVSSTNFKSTGLTAVAVRTSWSNGDRLLHRLSYRRTLEAPNFMKIIACIFSCCCRLVLTVVACSTVCWCSMLVASLLFVRLVL